MRAYGKGLELTVELSADEIKEVSCKNIQGMIKIYDYQDKFRVIEFSVSTKTTLDMAENIKSDGVFVKSNPQNTYLPHCSNIELFLGDEEYKSLQRRGEYITRFSTGGKVIIVDTSIKKDRDY